MNITREQLGELEYLVKVEIEEKDYIEKVKKELKDYQKKATIPGFRRGMAPMALIQRMYKAALVGDTVQNELNTSLFKYIDDEKLHILGMPMSNDERTGEVDFGSGTDFTFYFNIAVAPEFDIDWSNINVVYNQIKVSSKDVEAEISNMCTRYGRFETPETVGKGDIIYGRLVELDKKGEHKEGGVETFVSLNMLNLKDEEQLPLFEGKKADDVVRFNMAKAFATADIEHALRIDTAAAKKFKSDVELTLSGISRVIPHEVDADLFKLAFPTQDIQDADAFSKAVKKQIEHDNGKQSDYLYVNQVRKALIDQFNATIPEDFLKRWFASRGEEGMTPERIEEEWAEKYLPSLKWELIESKLEEIKPVEPTSNQIVDYIKDILRRNDKPAEDETAEQTEQRLEQAARSIAADRKNISQVIDTLYADNLATLLKEQCKPTVEKVSAKEFGERASA
ncbi:MAG: hypothetical protein IJ760_05390 [Bacteroidales bacterium]|nr:hypothetical protein [Bacteroidales bacterium]